ncbi:hypothetical protein E2C01_094862 [Portunus trituberculatus]|uniref:Uncharacterized protein n=1 Tax=Portunus trituberculatus TaxID=210409 RepID=A0A5B7JXA5_PORTR|nr:hypothetical protein [Portunus trituberculatus]
MNLHESQDSSQTTGTARQLPSTAPLAAHAPLPLSPGHSMDDSV